MADTQIKNVTFTEAVLRRPAMYTLQGAFAEAVAFLEGYYSGVAKANPYAASVLEWQDFRIWLSEQLDVDTAEVFARISECYPDSQIALSKMLDWLDSFHESRIREPRK